MTSATSNAAARTGARHTKHRRATTRGVSALMYASQQGDVDRVRNIIREQSATLLTRDRTGKTPLHYCCTSDNICAAQAADLLVMAAPDLVESHDEDGFTPLHLAVIAGNVPLVTFLLANKADVNAVDNEKHTVVHWATVCGETAALRAVLAAGAPVSTPDVHGGYPLHYAAQMCGGDKDSNLGLQVLQTLLTHSDIVVSVEDGDGRQPLLWAASAGSAKAVLALVRAGATVEAPDKDGLTALHCAASRGHTDCIDSLLTLCGASPDVIDSNGCTALHYAVTLGHADATALLLAHGADPNRQDRKGRSPAHCGCAKGQFETVKMIGAHGANLWLRNARGDLPLHEAAASGRRDLVRWLLDMRPSQVNARNNDGRCPLHLAALNDNADMCKILLDAGAQVNPILRTSKNTFMTPLDCALQRGFRSTAKYLQLHGGIPSNRLGDIRQRQVNTGINLQIRDDVTFWGDTSSDSERENGDATKHSKKVQRKKLSNKYEKKRASLSGSDLENNKFASGKLESGRTKRRLNEKNQRVKTGGRTDSATSMIDPPKRSHRKTPTGKVDYSNEIVINDKTEINIHQTKEINVVGAEEQVKAKVTSNLPKEVIEKATTEGSVEKDKRPKSAKHSKVRDKSTSLMENEGILKRKTKVEKQQQKQASVNQHLQNDGIQNVRKQSIANKNGKDETVSKEISATKQKPFPDQRSQMSNTSDEVEEHQSLIVEAAVHEPPKTIEPRIEERVAEKSLESDKRLETDENITPENNVAHDKINGGYENIEKITEDQNNEKTATKSSSIEATEEMDKISGEDQQVVIETTNNEKISSSKAVPEAEETIDNETNREEITANTKIDTGVATELEARITETPVTEITQPITEEQVDGSAPLSSSEEVKSSETKSEEVKVGDSKGEEVKTEEATAEEANVEAAEVEETKLDEARVEKDKTEEANVEPAKVEEIKNEETKAEETIPDHEPEVKEKNHADADAVVEKETNNETNLVSTTSINEDVSQDTVTKDNEGETDETVEKAEVSQNDGHQEQKVNVVTKTEGTTSNDIVIERKSTAEYDKINDGITEEAETGIPIIEEITNEIQDKVKRNHISVAQKTNQDNTSPIHTQGDVHEVSTEKTINNKEGKLQVHEDEGAKNDEIIKADVSLKPKKKNHRKKRQVPDSEDKSYEIIYKTMGASDDDDVTPKPELNEDKTPKKIKEEPKDKSKTEKDVADSKSSEDYSSDTQSNSSSSSITVKEHKSFRVLDDNEAEEIEKMKPMSRKQRKSKSPPKKQRPRSEENQILKEHNKEPGKGRKSRIPTPLTKSHLSKSDKHLDVPDRKVKSNMESRVPSLPNINENRDRLKEPPRSESNMSAPPLESIYSDNEHASASDLEEVRRSSAVRKKKVKRRPKPREARSAGSDYESSNIIDSGFEPSPRSSRIPKWRNMTERGVNMSSVTQSIQSNIRRYHLERKIFQHLLELKRMQIRAGQHNEALLVKRAIDAYHQSCAATVGAGRYVPEDYTFKSFEKFLYLSLRKLQRNGADHLKGLPEPPANPLLCTQSTHRCMHATHAYTGIPCAAYLPKMDHHAIPKIGFTSAQCKPGTGFLPTINPKKAVTLELCHGNDKQVISLPADRLDQNKRYYVTFTVKGNENVSPNEETATGHLHSKSD